MASKAPQSCCTAGVKHEGSSTGEFISIDNSIRTYVSGDKTSGKVLLYCTDILGPDFLNAQLLADSYAAKGYYVVVPDLFYGDALKLGEKVTPEWLSKHGLEKTESVVLQALQWIKKEIKPSYITSLGHCFGAKYTIRLLTGEIDAGAVAHPSFVDMAEIEAIKRPLLISAAEQDPIFPDESRAATEVKLKEIKATYYVSFTSGVVHGFAVRGDPKDKWSVIAKNKAFADTIWWFELFNE